MFHGDLQETSRFPHGFPMFSSTGVQGAHGVEAVQGPLPAARARAGVEARGTADKLRIGRQARGTHPGANGALKVSCDDADSP